MKYDGCALCKKDDVNSIHVPKVRALVLNQSIG